LSGVAYLARRSAAAARAPGAMRRAAILRRSCADYTAS
jgi:hypothetical protein